MDVATGASVLLYRTSKPVGKVRRRVLDLRIPSSSYLDSLSSSSTLDLSHNESVRLAADRLLSGGLEGYQQVLKEEGEVDFLSELEKKYILENGQKGNNTGDAGVSGEETEFESWSAGSQSPTCHPASSDSEQTVEETEQRRPTDSVSQQPFLNESSLEIFFHQASGMKDLVRQFIREAKQALALVMDSFSDVELLCDLLEASRKRNVSVHLLLDRLNLGLFLNMWQELNLHSKNFPKLSVRSVHGQTYCSRTGRKLTGQITERFIISDWKEVITGSFSFSWLSWQVHRGLAVRFKGSPFVPFHQEFLRLHSTSAPLTDFVTFISAPPPAVCPPSTGATEPAVSKRKSDRGETMCLWTLDENEENTENKAVGDPPPTYLKPLVQPERTRDICSQEEVKIKAGIGRPSDPHQTADQNDFSSLQSQLPGLTITAVPEKDRKAQESNPWISPLKTLRYQSTLRSDSHPEHPKVSSSGPSNPLVKPLGWNTHRGPRDLSPMVEHPSKIHKYSTQSPSRPKQAQTSPQFPLLPRWHTQELQKPQIQSTPTATGPGPRTQNANLGPWMTWTSQNPQRPRVLERQSSFGAPRGTGPATAGQTGWRSFNGGVNRSLGRSKSLTERCSFRGGDTS